MLTVFYRQEWFGASHVFDRPHYSGYLEWATNRIDASTPAAFSICGHRGGEVECLVPEGDSDPWQQGWIKGGWTVLRSTASRVEETDCC